MKNNDRNWMLSADRVDWNYLRHSGTICQTQTSSSDRNKGLHNTLRVASRVFVYLLQPLEFFKCLVPCCIEKVIEKKAFSNGSSSETLSFTLELLSYPGHTAQRLSSRRPCHRRCPWCICLCPSQWAHWCWATADLQWPQTWLSLRPPF